MGTLSAEKPIDFVKRDISKIFTVLLQLRIDTAIKCPEAEAMDCLYLVRSSVTKIFLFFNSFLALKTLFFAFLWFEYGVCYFCFG